MLHRFLRIGLVQSLVLFTQTGVPNQLHSTAQYINKMEAIKTMEDMGYAFNTEGKLRQLNENGELSDEPFQFNISDDHRECQAHYEKMGNAVTQYVYHLLETQEHLTRLPVPIDAAPETPEHYNAAPESSVHGDAAPDTRELNNATPESLMHGDSAPATPEHEGASESNKETFIFASQDYDKKDTLLVLIHGSGVVRAGQWARSLIINQSLDKGTQIPYIRKAIAKGYGVLVMNTNDNFTKDGEEIPESENPERHGVYVWRNYVSNAKAENILIVAHSYGGVVTVDLAHKLEDDFERRVKAIAFTDSVHGFSKNRVTQYLKQVAKNWVGSSDPLDTPIRGLNYDVPKVSAGHRQHEMTSYAAMDSVFKFFDEKLTEVPEASTDESDNSM